jgi:hypothetical protein
VAWYGRRHVLQLVCIKRLQAQGLPLARVQEQLAGATTRRLSSLAALPPDFWDRPLTCASELPIQERSPAPSPARAAFWAEPAAASADLPASAPPQVVSCIRLPISPGIALEIAGQDFRRLTADQAAGLRPLIENLSRELDRLGLTGSPPSAEVPLSSPHSSSDSSGESPCC